MGRIALVGGGGYAWGEWIGQENADLILGATLTAKLSADIRGGHETAKLRGR